MTDDVGELLAELGREEVAGRDELAERARRQRVAAAVQRKLEEHVHAKPVRPARSRWWVLAPAAAAALAAVAAGFALSRPPAALQVAPEAPRALVTAEESLPAPAPAPAPVPRASERAASVVPSARLPAPRPTPALPPVTKGSASAEPSLDPSNALAAQNELFQEAARAERRGDDAGALTRLDALLARHPGSVLAADARIRKLRILERLGRGDEARAAAQSYLSHHPAGAAADEARKALQP